MAESELQKVKDLLDMGFIHEEEYERRIKEILGNAPIPQAFRVGNSSNTATDPFEEERLRRELEEEERLRAEEEELRRMEEEMRQSEEVARIAAEKAAMEAARYQYGAAERLRKEQEEKEAVMRRMLEERRRMEEEVMKRRMEEEFAKKRAEALANSTASYLNATTTAPPSTTSTTALTPEERKKAIAERQKRDAERWKAEVAEEQKRNMEREEQFRKQNPGYNPWATGSQPEYTAQETPAFNPNATYSVPQYYAPHGVNLYPIYPASYFATVHPFAFVAADGKDPNNQSAGREHEENIKRIIAENIKNKAGSGNFEDQQYVERMRRENEMEEQRRAEMRRIVDQTPKKPIPAKVDDGIDPNTLPQPTVHMIPPRKWDDSTVPHEAPKYVIPQKINGVIVLHRDESMVCQSKELDAPTLDSVFKMFDMSEGKLTNVATGEEFKSMGTIPSGCYKLERKIDFKFYRSIGTMPLYASSYTLSSQGNRHSFHSQFERVPSAIAHKRTTTFVDDIVFSYGNVRTNSTLRVNSYNESAKPPQPYGNETNINSVASPYSAQPGWFKNFRETNVKTDYVVCIRNVFRKAGKEPPLRLHRALKDSLDNNKCVVCKQFATNILCDTHKNEHFAALVQSVGGNFGEIFGVSTEPLSMEEEVESPIYYKNYGEVVTHEGDNAKVPFIDFLDPNLQPKYTLNGILAERFNRIKENARMSYDMMMNDDYLVHKPGSEQARLYD